MLWVNHEITEKYVIEMPIPHQIFQKFIEENMKLYLSRKLSQLLSPKGNDKSQYLKFVQLGQQLLKTNIWSILETYNLEALL